MTMLAAPAAAQTTHLHCGRVLTMEGDETLTSATIVVEGKKISRIERGYTPPPVGAELIDLKTKIVLPGVMDRQVRIESEQNRFTCVDRVTLDNADRAFRAAAFASRTLPAGFTTVRNLGWHGRNIALRHAINTGWADGPRIFTAWSIINITGGVTMVALRVDAFGTVCHERGEGVQSGARMN